MERIFHFVVHDSAWYMVELQEASFSLAFLLLHLVLFYSPVVEHLALINKENVSTFWLHSQHVLDIMFWR